MIENILVLLAILIVLLELYRFLRAIWLRQLLGKKKKVKRPRKPMVLKPKSERACRFCQEDKGKRRSISRELPEPWSARKGRGGRKKQFSTEGYFCSNPICDYYHITDERVQALVANGTHGTQEVIQDLKCQACGKKFTARGGHNPLPAENALRAGGENCVAVSVRRGCFCFRGGVRRTGDHHPHLVVSQRNAGEETARAISGGAGVDPRAARRTVGEYVVRQPGYVAVGGKRCQNQAGAGLADRRTQPGNGVFRGARVKGRLAACCVPVFSMDGLKHYFYALTAHFGEWEASDGKKPVWVLLGEFVYGQVIKHQRRRRTVEVERRVLLLMVRSNLDKF